MIGSYGHLGKAQSYRASGPAEADVSADVMAPEGVRDPYRLRASRPAVAWQRARPIKPHYSPQVQTVTAYRTAAEPQPSPHSMSESMSAIHGEPTVLPRRQPIRLRWVGLLATVGVGYLIYRAATKRRRR